MSEKEDREMLAQLCRDMMSASLSNEKMIQMIEEKMQPLKDKIQKLSDENRRMKISLSFFETELREAVTRQESRKILTKDAQSQVDEMSFLKEIEPEEKNSNADKQVNGHMDSSLKRVLSHESDPLKAKRLATADTAPVSKSHSSSSTNNTSKTDWRGVISVPPRTMQTRTTARKSTTNWPAKPVQALAPKTPATITPQPAAAAPRTGQVFQLQTKPGGPAQTVTMNPGVLSGLQSGHLFLIQQNGQLIASPTNAAVGGLLLRPAAATSTTTIASANGAAVSARPVSRNTAVCTQPPATTVVDKNIWNSFVNLKNQQQQQQQQAKVITTYSKAVNNSAVIGSATPNLLALMSGNSGSTSFPIIAPKPPAASSITISAVHKAAPVPAHQKVDPSSLSISEVPAKIVTRNGSMNTADEDEEMDVEVVPPPPKPPTPDIVDLSDDDEEEVGKTVLQEQEILSEEPDCANHPVSCPSLPFAVLESILPKPRLSVRMGMSRDSKRAVILRMESAVDSTLCQGFLQYRIFSYFQNESEPSGDRKWKQLTCIKVKCGKICECTLTQLVANARYHFVVCLVNGNNRSRFSNCATTRFA